ncbi:DUF4397 domain-containing protein [Actinomycetospora straminea]|uniref:DUF4397 domain-containing protein n=1 Tax=Actinomycetospora straminea TaxID=663607 RepID=A0ABP9EPP7_9PSEU|nr:DUF4397 domain-containing protein [Actinomycetospora straminea]MDD7934052.1 DUF4397 domain-containing protein [Actinomycetospora straminea]
MRRLARAAGGVLIASAIALTTAGTAAAQETGTVYVVHGIPDTPVDVYVDGERALDDFAPGTSQGPLDLPSGPHQVAIFPADAADDSGEALLSGQADVPAGGNVTLAAHLTAEGQPALSPLVNEVGSVPAGQARVVVRHLAAAPAVDVLAGGQPVVQGLTNPNQEALEVPAGTVSAAVAAAGTTDPVIGPADLTLEEGTTTFVHAIGSLDQNNLELVTFTVGGGDSAPNGVPAGAPSGAPAGGPIAGWVALSALGVAIVGVSLARLRPAGRR